MEIKGEEFIKKVQIKQEQDELEQRLNKLNEAVNAYENENGVTMPKNPSPQTQQAQINAYAQQQTRLHDNIEVDEQEYSDIMLGGAAAAPKNSQNKKKYLVLGLVLVILFLITIIVIRLLTNDSVDDDSFSKADDVNQEKVLENENIDEQYQKIINEKLKSIKEENEKTQAVQEETEKNLDLEKIEKEEKVITPISKPSKPDVFDIKKEKKVEPKPVVRKPVVKKVEPKPVVKKPVGRKPVAKTTAKSNVSTSKPKGTFVQIGAFTKMPESKYLQNITKKGFKYKIYKTQIKGKTYHKLLIGPYSSRGQAKLASENIKQKLNAGTFIIKF